MGVKEIKGGEGGTTVIQKVVNNIELEIDFGRELVLGLDVVNGE